MYEMNRHFEYSQRQDEKQWHKVRVLASLLMQPHLKKGKKISPQDLIPLPNDIKSVRMSDERLIEDIKRKSENFSNYWNRRN